MNAYSDEPVLIKAPRRLSLKHWVAIGVTLALAGGVAYIPIDKARMDARAHDIARGPHSGSLYNISIEGRPHTLELAWSQGGFALVLQPAPAAGTTLIVSSRAGKETLEWNDKLATFGPGKLAADPYSHYKLDLVLRNAGKAIWENSLWAYAYHDHHGHSH